MTTDVVCVLDAALAQVFPDARPIKATIRETAKAMEHPLESGATMTDHRVIEPVEIELCVVLTGDRYPAVYQQIRQYFVRSELLTVQTRTASYGNMMLIAMPHEECPDAADAINLALTLRETVLVAALFSDLKVKKPTDRKTVPRGEQQPQSSKKQSSVLSGIFK